MGSTTRFGAPLLPEVATTTAVATGTSSGRPSGCGAARRERQDRRPGSVERGAEGDRQVGGIPRGDGEQGAHQNAYGNPPKSGGRFSRKASRPSAASSLA